MNRNPRRRSSQQSHETPVVLPHVVITVTDDAGALNVTVDGTAFPPPHDGGRWTRDTLGTLLDAITQDWTIPVRIEVHEIDGTVFTDLIHARRLTAPEADPGDHHDKPTTTKRRRRGEQGPVSVEITADGFLPGENVAVAIIVSHTDATRAGTARALIDLTHFTSSPSEDNPAQVVLVGRVSGTTRSRRLP